MLDKKVVYDKRRNRTRLSYTKFCNPNFITCLLQFFTTRCM